MFLCHNFQSTWLRVIRPRPSFPRPLQVKVASQNYLYTKLSSCYLAAFHNVALGQRLFFRIRTWQICIVNARNSVMWENLKTPAGKITNMFDYVANHVDIATCWAFHDENIEPFRPKLNNCIEIWLTLWLYLIAVFVLIPRLHFLTFENSFESECLTDGRIILLLYCKRLGFLFSAQGNCGCGNASAVFREI